VTYHDSIYHKFQPRENQKIAIDKTVEALLDRGFYGLLLEMSLGKTKVSLNVAEILAKMGRIKRILIICPKAIQSVWQDEIPKHSNFDIEPFVWVNKHTKKYKDAKKAFKAQEFQILLAGLEMFQRENLNLEWDLNELYEEPTLVILDESSKIKNVTTQRAPRVIKYTRDAAYRVILTGTPWSESPLDIFSQMEFLKEGFWYKFEKPWKPSTLRKHWYIFRNRYAIMQEVSLGTGRTFKTMVGTRRTEEVARKIQPHVIQQKKEDWLDLPEKIFQTLHVEMPKEQAEAYSSMKDRLILEMGDEILTANNAGTLLVRLRQIAGGFYPETGEPICKEIAGIDALLEDVDGYPGKVVIAASFVAEIKGIVDALARVYGEDMVTTYYGATKDRDHEVARFKDHAKFMVVNPQSAGYGLNLQFSSLMYRYSLPFSYELNKQLEDRIHRPGMTGSAVYKDIVTVGTVQEKVVKALEKKQGVVDEFDRMTVAEYLTTT
jgi:SNF2 family DNA or RNA helicase